MVLLSRTRGQGLHKIGHTESVREIEESHSLLRFQHRNIPIVNARELVRSDGSVVRPLHEIENERNREDRDDNHQPVAMLAQQLHHNEIRL